MGDAAHETLYKSGNFIRFGVHRKMPCVEDVNFCVRHILTEPRGFSAIEGRIMFAPEGATKADALRQAQIEMMKSGEPPYYWAGFELDGEPSDSLSGQAADHLLQRSSR